MRFLHKVAIVTGGSTGIGRAMCELLAKEGCTVYNFDINQKAENIEGVHFLRCDIKNHSEIKENVRKVFDEKKKIDFLFANAGIHMSGKIEDISDEELNNIVDTNLKGMWYSLKEVLPIMREQNRGSIVLMGSDQCFVGKGESAAYGLTKGAIGQLTKSTAIDYAPYNIRVNCVCPGTIDTPLAENAVRNFAKKLKISEEEIYKSLATAQPIKRLGTSKEVANLVAFLFSDESSFTTGSLYSVDGGYVAQ